jgi:hypothetical protein
MLPIFIGYDPRQTVSFTTLVHSLVTRASEPLAITPLVQETLPVRRQGLTPFSYSRFLVPYLCGYRGWALFLDVDMLALADIASLFDQRDARHAVMVVKNRLRFEWASVMLFNCDHPDNRALTPDWLDQAPAPHLIDWTEAVGALSDDWNHLVGYDRPRSDTKLVHFTQGVPCFPETAASEHGAVWRAAALAAMASEPWTALMGQSVHAVVGPDGRCRPRLQTMEPAPCQ